jgi:hypothetical protein
LTYVYADSTAVVGPLAAFSEPHSYDLCEQHALSLTAPRGWKLVRPDGHFEPPPANDDLLALADAVREAARRSGAAAEIHTPGSTPPDPRRPSRGPTSGTGRRGHLRVIPPSS